MLRCGQEYEQKYDNGNERHDYQETCERIENARIFRMSLGHFHISVLVAIDGSIREHNRRYRAPQRNWQTTKSQNNIRK